MNIIWAICRRDLLQAFTTPLAWLVLACWALLTNGVFVMSLYQYHGTSGASAPLFVTAMNLGVLFLLLLAPAITMMAFSAERAQGTMQLLLTVPIREWQLVIGKWLAAFGVFLAMLAVTLIHPFVLLFVSQVDGMQLLAGYLGLMLVCAFFSALGIWISLLVDTPVAAYVITFGAIAVLFLIGIMERSPGLAPLAQAVGLQPRSSPFFTGVVNLGDVAYFVSFTAACLVMAHAALMARRING